MKGSYATYLKLPPYHDEDARMPYMPSNVYIQLAWYIRIGNNSHHRGTAWIHPGPLLIINEKKINKQTNKDMSAMLSA